MTGNVDAAATPAAETGLCRETEIVPGRAAATCRRPEAETARRLDVETSRRSDGETSLEISPRFEGATSREIAPQFDGVAATVREAAAATAGDLEAATVRVPAAATCHRADGAISLGHEAAIFLGRGAATFPGFGARVYLGPAAIDRDRDAAIFLWAATAIVLCCDLRQKIGYNPLYRVARGNSIGHLPFLGNLDVATNTTSGDSSREFLTISRLLRMFFLGRVFVLLLNKLNFHSKIN